MKSKKKVSIVFNGSFESRIRCSGLDDEEQKKVLGVFNGSFLSNLVGGGHSFFNFFLGSLLKKSLGNPALI